jgi:cell wall-associated NlpC family hydrolase
LPDAVQRGARIAPISNTPSGRLHPLAILVIAVSLGITLVAIDGRASTFAIETAGTESASGAFQPEVVDDYPATSVSEPAHSGRAHTNANASESHRSEAHRIVAIARRYLGAKFLMGATGPRYFDCSGLIYRVYERAGLLGRIGGNHTAAGYYYWFKQRGQASRSRPKVGDLVIWTHHGRIAHSGIYVGNGHVISALVNPWGVKKTHIHTIHARFFAYLHVRLDR